MSAKSCTFEVLTTKELHHLLMCKDTTLFLDMQEEKDFSLRKSNFEKKVRIDFNAPDLSSNGGLVLFQGKDCSLLDKMADCIPDWRAPELIYLFVENFIKSFKKAPKRIILDADDTNANTYGAQQLTLFNDYYGEYCYLPLLIYEGLSGKMIH